ncbi:hypothetical protein [Streptomyces liangshanensis]|uniref:hypothetical protein n=1 Tax=Streptomyces liangshanensis TaxID=2717324 RepID=UPI0036D9A885
MQNTRTKWLRAAQRGARPAWFHLSRHDDPDPADPKDPAPKDPTKPADPKDPDPNDPDPEGADKLGDAGQKALAAMKAERAAAKKEAADAKKEAAAAQKRVAEYEDRDKSELEKATERAEKAETRAKAATARAVKAEITARAGAFVDPTDTEQLGDLTRYANENGEIDTTAIEADLKALLARKPHLGKPAEEEKKPGPKPDPGQGPRLPEPPSNFQSASHEEYVAELAKYGLSPRR